MNDIIEEEKFKDDKSNFQEIAQEKLNITPVYKVLDSWGPDHQKTFKVAVYVGDEEFGVGEGASKQRAEQEAARKALDKINSL